MSRIYEFSRATKLQAFLRQECKCAGCGDALEHPQNAVYHHVIPNRSGDGVSPGHEFLRTSDNCVAVCPGCHELAHDGARYKLGGVETPAEFPWSHGHDATEHEEWRRAGEQRWELLQGMAAKPCAEGLPANTPAKGEEIHRTRSKSR